MAYFGSHMKMCETMTPIEAALKVKKAGGNLIQIYANTYLSEVKSQKAFKEFLKKNKMKIIIHASCGYNLSKNWDQYSHWIKKIEIEIKLAYDLKALGIVFHFGKQLKLSKEEAYNNMYTSLIHIHNNTKKFKVKLILETPAGQGTEICYKIEDLAKFYKKFSKGDRELKNRIKICIDTCHIFSAGYDIRTKKKIILFLKKINKLIGLNNVALIHLNDSKTELGSRIDRHDSIGEGKIGFKGLRHIFKFFKKMKVPIILETPGNSYKYEIKKFSLV